MNWKRNRKTYKLKNNNLLRSILPSGKAVFSRRDCNARGTPLFLKYVLRLDKPPQRDVTHRTAGIMTHIISHGMKLYDSYIKTYKLQNRQAVIQ